MDRRRWEVGATVLPRNPDAMVRGLEKDGRGWARVPCEGGGVGVRDVFRRNSDQKFDQTVYAVFVGSYGRMREIFRCDDLLWREGDYWVYRPTNLRRFK
ncbi:hypothetical protein U1Q18_015435 [Sarracenia purpurea var. burkii]